MKRFSFGMCVPLLVTGIFMGADVVLSAYFFRVTGHSLISYALLGMTLPMVVKVMKLTWRIRRHEFYSHMMVIPFFPWLWLAGIKLAELLTTAGISSFRFPASGLTGATAMVSIAFTLFQVWRFHATVVKSPVSAGRPEPWSMKLKTAKCLVLLSAMLLCACDSEESRFDAARTRALQNTDPWQAYVQLSADAERDCPSGLLESACSGKTLADYRGLAQTLYRKALSRSSPGAFADLFLRSVPPGVLEPQMPELAKKLIVMAGKSPGDRASAALLLAAGDVLQKGEWVQKDSVQAAAFYARAWLAGSAKAASRLSHLYSLQHDDASALLWQNRCTGECYPGQELVDVPASWSPRKILRIQALAKDRSIVTVNGQADWEDK